MVTAPFLTCFSGTPEGPDTRGRPNAARGKGRSNSKTGFRCHGAPGSRISNERRPGLLVVPRRELQPGGRGERPTRNADVHQAQTEQGSTRSSRETATCTRGKSSCNERSSRRVRRSLADRKTVGERVGLERALQARFARVARSSSSPSPTLRESPPSTPAPRVKPTSSVTATP